ncbi:MAG: hypothetical protein AB7Q17_13105 [Phycisphaerae bacterium]
MVKPALGLVVSACVAVTLLGCRAATPHAGGSAPRPQLFSGMGSHSRAIRTSDRVAQQYFDQGLVWAYAFNHDEAIRSFQEAARRDPACALPWWGVALANGPHINNPIVTPERSQAAWTALQEALARRPNASACEQALIDALAARYANPAPDDRRPLDEAYAAAMGRVWQSYPEDVDVGTLYAESLMDLQPWDLWDSAGQPKGRTNEILAVLERVLELDPKHPGACHLYIHAQEAGPNPQKADAAAAILRKAVPAASHLVHMPAHIDVQMGRWALAADQNVRATEADTRYRKLVPRQGFYRLYMAHNHHFLAFASMMEGRSAAALAAARAMIANVPEDYARENAALMDPYMMIALDVLKRFGRWDDVLAEPAAPDYLPITTAYRHYARGVALAAKGDAAAAKDEQAAFRNAVKNVPDDALMAINPAHKVLAIAEHVLDGEIALSERRIDAAVAALQEAVTIEDTLLYMEPPEWIQPARHTLGAILVGARRFREAEQVYRDDLERWPENGWSLHGLMTCLKAQNKATEAAAVEQRFKKTWARADVKIGSSCLCVPENARLAAK